MSLLASGILALAPCLVAPRADVTFAATPPKAGQKLVIASASQMKFTMTVKSGGNELQKMEMPGSEDVACTVTVTAADEKGPTAAKLEFGKSTKVEASPLGGGDAVHTCSEKTYEVKRGDAGFAPPAGTPDDQKMTVAWICDQTLAVPLAAALAGKTLKDGETVAVSEEDAHKAFAMFASEFTVKDMKLTLAGQQSTNGVDAALFKVSAKLVKSTAEGNPTTAEIDVSGDLAVAKDSLLILNSSLSGPMKIDGTRDQGGMKLVMEGRGTVTWKYSVKPE